LASCRADVASGSRDVVHLFSSQLRGNAVVRIFEERARRTRQGISAQVTCPCCCGLATRPSSRRVVSLQEIGAVLKGMGVHRADSPGALYLICWTTGQESMGRNPTVSPHNILFRGRAFRVGRTGAELRLDPSEDGPGGRQPRRAASGDPLGEPEEMRQFPVRSYSAREPHVPTASRSNASALYQPSH
jgi:hypothetical protein